MTDLQHYPTPKALAELAWSKFKNRTISRLLEPSAGKGDLILPRKPSNWNQLPFKWDAIEMNPGHHPALRELGATVVGYDFLSFGNCSIYSHILLNPPFAQGAAHVMHAWNGLYDGEIVAIVNAETVRNQFSAERQMLGRLIEAHGSVEFVVDAFKGADVERQAAVDVAIIYLKKSANSRDVLGDYLDGLDVDGTDTSGDGWKPDHELAIPEGFVEATVRNFNLATKAALDAARAEARASHYQARLGKTMSQMLSDEKGDGTDTNVPIQASRNLYAERYEKLREAAWTQIIRSTHVLDRVSHAARKRVESEFETISKLEFTASNVYGFLHGLVQSSGKIQMEMACDVFDTITCYHSENTVYFMGWRSNDRHRTAGMRIKRTRFIMPGHSATGYQRTASYNTLSMLSDFDKVFAMLDGKSVPEVSLRSLFENAHTYGELKDGARLSSSYFDVRLYPQRGTIHFFPRNMEVVERLNRVVGQYRQWLPPSMDDVSPDFRRQYDMAEKIHDEVLAETRNASGGLRDTVWNFSRARGEEQSRAAEALDALIGRVLERHDIHPFDRIEGAGQSQQLLALAA